MLSVRPVVHMSQGMMSNKVPRYCHDEIIQIPKKKRQLDTLEKTENKRRKVSTKQMKKWTDVENERLLLAVKRQQNNHKFEKLNFDMVSKYVGTRTREQCRQRYNKTILEQKSQVKRGQWAAEEDVKLQELIKEHIVHEKVNWKGVKQECIIRVRRNIKQCKERWENFLSPNVNNGPFTEVEDEKILKFRKANMGWSEISKNMKGRSQDKIKSRYNTLVNTKKKQKKLSLVRQSQSASVKKIDPVPTKVEEQLNYERSTQDNNTTPNQPRYNVHTKPNIEDAKLLLNQANGQPIRITKSITATKPMHVAAPMVSSPVVLPYSTVCSTGYNTNFVSSQGGMQVPNDCSVSVPTVTLETNSIILIPNHQTTPHVYYAPHQNYIPQHNFASNAVICPSPPVGSQQPQYFVPMNNVVHRPTTMHP